MITPEDFDEMIKLICPHCRRGVTSRHRPETQEWVHDWVTLQTLNEGMMGHAICWASGLRLSRFNPHPQDFADGP